MNKNISGKYEPSIHEITRNSSSLNIYVYGERCFLGAAQSEVASSALCLQGLGNTHFSFP